MSELNLPEGAILTSDEPKDNLNLPKGATLTSDFPGQEGLAGTIVDVATTMGTGAAGYVAELGGRLVGLGVGALPGGGTPTDTALEFGESARNAIATEPTTEGGKRFMEGLGFLVEEAKGLADITGAGISGAAQLMANLASGNTLDDSISAAAQEIEKTRSQGLAPTVRENIFEATGSPAAAAAFGALPETALLAAGGIKTPGRIEAGTTGSRGLGGVKPSKNLERDVRISGRDTLPRDKSARIGAKAEVDTVAAQAFDDLGISPTPDLIATDAEFINLTNSVAEKVGSKLASKRANVIQELSAKADELIVSSGGKTDRSAVSANIENEFKTTIEGISKEETVSWKPINDIQGSTIVKASDDLRTYVDERLADVKGQRAKLSALDKDIYDLVYKRVPARESSTINKKTGEEVLGKIRRDENGQVIYEDILTDTTISMINVARSKTGRAGGKLDKIYPESSSREIGRAYGTLAKEQKSLIPDNLQNDFTIANTLTSKRKALEESSKNLFGKSLEKGLIPRIEQTSNALVKGDVKPLRKLLHDVPKESRAEVAATVLDSIIKKPGGDVQTSFVDRYNGISRNKQAMDELFRYLPPEARSTFKNIGIVSERLLRSPTVRESSAVRTAIAHGAVEKIIHAERAIPFAGRAISGTTRVLTEFFTSPKKTLKATDAFLSSPELIDAIKAQAAGNAARANNIIGSSPRYQKWLATLDSTLRSRIVKTGFVTWLLSEEDQ